MSHYGPPPPGKDPQLWEIAQRRASFKSHLLVYVIVIAGLWAIWFFTGQHLSHRGFPWPLFPMFGWGIGLFFHFAGAYLYKGFGSVEKEYEKLSKK